MIDPSNGLTVRSRQPGDRLRLSGGTKTLKKCFIDRKIPAAQRDLIPVFADSTGILAVCGLGVDLDRTAVEGQPAILIQIEKE